MVTDVQKLPRTCALSGGEYIAMLPWYGRAVSLVPARFQYMSSLSDNTVGHMNSAVSFDWPGICLDQTLTFSHRLRQRFAKPSSKDFQIVSAKSGRTP